LMAAQCPASRCAPRLSGRPLRRHQMGRYQGPLVLTVARPARSTIGRFP
jgi:hypothetical protein